MQASKGHYSTHTAELEKTGNVTAESAIFHAKLNGSLCTACVEECFSWLGEGALHHCLGASGGWSDVDFTLLI